MAGWGAEKDSGKFAFSTAVCPLPALCLGIGGPCGGAGTLIFLLALFFAGCAVLYGAGRAIKSFFGPPKPPRNPYEGY